MHYQPTTITPYDGEFWKLIPQFEELYAISNRGRLLSLRNGKERLRSLSVGKHGYYATQLSKDGKDYTIAIHTMVLRVFAGERPQGMVIRHLNNVKTDNRWPENIVYGTYKENAADAIAAGTHVSCDKKAVDMYTLQGVYLQSFSSILEASTTTGLAHGNILQCCNSKRNRVGNYQFRWAVIDISQEAA